MRRHPVFARLYARGRPTGEARLVEDEYRRELLAGLEGYVLEVGCGDGRNFPFYPPEVKQVVGLEPEPYLLNRARDAECSVPVRLKCGSVEDVTRLGAVEFFDAVVFSLVLCSVDDPDRVLRNVKTVLRPGAAVRFYEHVLAPTRGLARWQRILAPLWSLIAGGCRCDRPLDRLLEREFAMQWTVRFHYQADLKSFLCSPRVIMKGQHGSARL